MARPPWPVSYFCQGALDGKLEDFKLKNSECNFQNGKQLPAGSREFLKVLIWCLFFGIDTSRISRTDMRFKQKIKHVFLHVVLVE